MEGEVAGVVALTVLQPNGDVLTARDGTVVDLSALTMIALETVWVPGKVEPKIGANGKVMPRRGGALGPKGESADDGKWCLRLPSSAETPSWRHLGEPGSIYEGPTLSSSAMETNSECDAKWAFERLDNEEKPPNRPAEMGGERHAELNRWLAFGTMPTTDGMAQLLPHFPMPGECESEVYFGFIFGRPGHEVVLAGYIDARQMPLPASGEDYAGSGSAIVDLYRPMHPIVRDLKTTGDFRWKKTAAQLRQHIQPNIYGLDAMLRSGHSVVLLKWTYALIKEPGVLKRIETVNEDGSSKDAKTCRGVLLTKKEAVATVARYVVQYGERMVEEILRVAAVLDAAKEAAKLAGSTTSPVLKSFAQEMPKNVESCSLYGGCPWKKTSVCNMPAGGGGFWSLLKADNVKRKITTDDAPPKIKAVSRLGNRFSKGLSAPIPQIVVEEKKERPVTELSSRFSKSLSKPTGTSSTGAPPATTPSPTTGTPSGTPPTTSTTTTTTTASALGSRFAKSKPRVTGTVTVPKEKEKEEEKPSKVDVKAEVDGVASGAPAQGFVDTRGPFDTTAPTPTTPSNADGGNVGQAASGLLGRLQELAKNGGANPNTAAVANAIAKAETRSVATVAGTAVIKEAKSAEENKLGAGAVGINPPDVAKEWTDEEQDEEAARIAAGKGGDGVKGPSGLAALPPDSATAATARAVVDAKEAEKAAKEAEKAAAKAAKEREKEEKAAAKEREKAEKAAAKAAQAGQATQATSAVHGAVETGELAPVAGAYTIAAAIEHLDRITVALVGSKHRKAAARVAEAVAELEAIAKGGET